MKNTIRQMIALFALLLSVCVHAQVWTFADPAFICQTNTGTTSWAPTNAYGWWHADSMLPTSDGTVITNFPDSVGGHNLAIWDKSTAHGPYFTNSMVNGYPAIYFLNSAHKGLTNAFGSTLPQILTWFVVASPTLTSGKTPYLIDGVGSGTREAFSMSYSTSTTFSNAFFGGTGFRYTDDKFIIGNTYLFTLVYNGNSSIVRTNGVAAPLLTAATIGTAGCLGFTLGDRYDNATAADAFGGWISEVILFNGSMAAGDMQWVESNLRTKYGL